MKKIFIGLIVIVILAVIFLGTTRKNDNIKIGLLLCQSGACAEWGENAVRGATLAVEEINASGGVLGKKLEIVNQDSNEDSPAYAINAYRNLVASGSSFIIGTTWTASGEAVAPVVAKDIGKTIVTSPSLGVDSFSKTSSNIFNLWPVSDAATRDLAHRAYLDGMRKVAIYSNNVTWYKEQGDAFADEFTKLGGKIVANENQNETDRDVRAVATKIMSKHPDAVVYVNFDNMGPMSKSLRILGFIGGQYAVSMDKTRLNSADGALEGVIYVQYEPPTSQFTNNFTKRFEKAPGISADSTFDVVHLYAKAIKDAGTTNVGQVNKVLSGYKEYEGASGQLTFNSDGGISKPSILWTVKDDNLVQIEK